MFKNILVPTDGTALSEAAIREAAMLAKELGSKVVLFYAPITPGLSLAMLPPKERAAAEKAMAEDAWNVLSSAAQSVELAGVTVEQHFTASKSASDAIIDAVKEFHCDLVVMAITRAKRHVGSDSRQRNGTRPERFERARHSRKVEVTAKLFLRRPCRC